MEAHHSRAVDTVLQRYGDRPEFVAVLLTGSIAHDFARPSSDVDIVLIATDEEHSRRVRDRQLAFSLWDICDYEGGYVDVKVVSLASLDLIAVRGSDPARYAFKDARVLVSREPDLPGLLARVTRYPVEAKADREHRFLCQLLAWKWYLSQAEEKRSAYLTHLSAQKFALFACRLVLNRAESLYPYHKWMLAETQRVAPEGLMPLIETFLEKPAFADAQAIADTLLALAGKSEKSVDWPNQFMTDSELNWVDHEAPIDDL